MPGEPPRRWWLVVLGAAALASSWNPIAAPFGLLVGVATGVLALRALRRSTGRRAVPATALALCVIAVAASVIVVALTAGSLGIELPGEPVVKARSQAELDQVLSEAAERTRARRERATRELDAIRSRDAAAAPDRRGGEPSDGRRRPPAREADAP